MKRLQKLTIYVLIFALTSCGLEETIDSKLDVFEPATLVVAAQIAFAVAGTISEHQDREETKRQFKRLSLKIDQARDAIINQMQLIYTNDSIVQVQSFLDDMRRFPWDDDLSSLERQISRGTEIKNRLKNVIHTMNTELALSVVPSLNLIAATTAALMEYRNTSPGIIEDDLKDLGATNYLVLEKHLPDRWYHRVSHHNRFPQTYVWLDGLFKIMCASDCVEKRILGARVASQTDQLYSDIVSFQESIRQIVRIKVKPAFGFSGYLTLDGHTMLRGDGDGNVCIFQSPQHLSLDNHGPTHTNQGITQHAFRLHRLTGACKVKYPSGVIQQANSNSIYYSNGIGAYCELPLGSNAPSYVYDFDIHAAAAYEYHGKC